MCMCNYDREFECIYATDIDIAISYPDPDQDSELALN